MAKKKEPTTQEPLKKTERKRSISLSMVEDRVGNNYGVDDITSYGVDTAKMSPLVKAVLRDLNGPKDSVERLAFESDPTVTDTYAGLYYQKRRLLPDELLKRIAIQDDLVAAIVQARMSHISTFGRPREDRFSSGFVIEPRKGMLDKLQDDNEKEELQKRIRVVVSRLETCGHLGGWNKAKRVSFADFLGQITRNAIIVGRVAIEIVTVPDMNDERERKFHSFRIVDAGTVYRATPQKNAQRRVREQARKLLEQVRSQRLDPDRYLNDEYAWMQVLQGRPMQAFTEEELIVKNFYQVPDVELDGYPVTPLDTMIAAVTTHLNITSHNKLYFQHGRASHGMLVIHSDEADDAVVENIKQQFNAAINSMANAWRMPVFGVGPDDDVVWSPIDNGGRDMEFQYLSDSNARVILSGFQMSPDELPGYSHLSRGTNSQALSESNGEYKLTAARDVGLRPLISKLEDLINQSIIPLLDPVVAKMCQFRMVGLEAETAEKESVRLQQDQGLHLTISEIMEKVEKKPIDSDLAGQMVLNPLWQAKLDAYVPVGVIREKIFGIQGASKDPTLQYYRDSFWFQWQTMLLQKQQMEMQAQAQQQGQAPGGQQPPQGGPGGGDAPQDPNAQQGAPEGAQQGDSPARAERGPGGGGGGDNPPEQTENQKNLDLSRTVDQAIASLGKAADLIKAEEKLPAGKRKLLQQQRKMVERFLNGFEQDKEQAMKEIMKAVRRVIPRVEKK